MSWYIIPACDTHTDNKVNKKKKLEERIGGWEAEVKCLLILDFLFNKSLLSSLCKDGHSSH